jgi:hypothetical protein
MTAARPRGSRQAKKSRRDLHRGGGENGREA